MDDAVWEASSPREKVLVAGLTDWVDLAQIHWFVALANPDASTATIQSETLDLIRALADEGLVTIGDLTAADGRFAAWNGSTEDSLRRIRGEYVDRFDDKNTWPWFSWLDLTDKGQSAAESVERKLNSSG